MTHFQLIYFTLQNKVIQKCTLRFGDLSEMENHDKNNRIQNTR